MTDFIPDSIDLIKKSRFVRLRIDKFIEDNKDKWFTVAQIVKALGLRTGTVREYLILLCNKHELDRIGEGRSTHYYGKPEVIDKLKKEVGIE